MASEKIKAFLEEIKSDPKAAMLLSDAAAPKNGKEEAAAYVKAAKKLGYDLTEEEFFAYIQEAVGEQKKKTEAGAAEIEQIPDEELEKAAGGKICFSVVKYLYCYNVLTHEPCKYTFKDRENCWATDACDVMLIKYDYYICNNNDAFSNCYMSAWLGCVEML